MREIKFRARDKNGEWVYGFYASGEYDCGNAVHYIVNDLTHIMSSCWGVDAIEIDHGTLGQYTGIKDKNGKDVYEGDVVKAVDIDTGEESLHTVKYYAYDDYPAFGLSPILFEESNSFSGIACSMQYEIEVVGDIYRNPKLLEA